MMANQTNHHRRSIRLPGWDYRTQAYYFVTICAHNRENLFDLAAPAEIAGMMWRLIPTQDFGRGVILDEWILMPNHLHGLLLMPKPTGMAPHNEDDEVIIPGLPFDIRYISHPPPAPPSNGRPRLLPGSLGAIIGQYKSGVTRRINNLRHSRGARVWQRGYYEHIVRNDRELRRIQDYIRDNPIRWAEDRENLEALTERMVLRAG